MAEIRIERTIEAPARRVWDIFSNLPGYEEWNPFIVRATGMLRREGTLNLTLVTQSESRMNVNPFITSMERGRQVAWATSTGPRWLFSRATNFLIEPEGEDRCKMTVSARFEGLLSPLRRGLISDLEAGYTVMLDALKARAESGARAPGTAAAAAT